MKTRSDAVFANVPADFRPDVSLLPQLVFPSPFCDFVWYRPHLNAASEILDKTVARVGRQKTAIIDASDGRQYTYGELADAVNRLGNTLTAHGVRPGDRVVLRLPEMFDMACAQLAVWKIGAIAVPMSVLDRVAEIRFVLEDTVATTAIVDGDGIREFEAAASGQRQLREVFVVGDACGHRALADAVRNSSAELAPYPSRPLDAASIFYTGGTTGYPKGCLHTHAGEVVISDLNNLARGTADTDVFLTHAPIGHAFGNGEKINFPLRAGATAVYKVRPSPAELFAVAERYGASIIAGASTMYRMMLREIDRPLQVFPNLRFRSALSSGEVLDERTAEAWEEAVHCELANVVGMTPMRHIFLDSRWLGRKAAPGLSVGRPLPGYEARIVDEEQHEVFDEAQMGRLAIRGPTGIAYWINIHPHIRDRARIDVCDGWSLLDDAYSRDSEGRLWFRTRLDDMVVTGGRQVAPAEVERLLTQHHAVAEVAVVAAPDEVRGQVVKAYVVLKDGVTGSDNLARELQDFAKQRMAPYKYPRQVEFVPALPKDAVGKIQRRKLRAQEHTSRVPPN